MIPTEYDDIFLFDQRWRCLTRGLLEDLKYYSFYKKEFIDIPLGQAPYVTFCPFSFIFSGCTEGGGCLGLSHLTKGGVHLVKKNTEKRQRKKRQEIHGENPKPPLARSGPRTAHRWFRGFDWADRGTHTLCGTSRSEIETASES